MAGDEVPDPHQRRMTASPFLVGCWAVRPRRTARPAGPLPALVAGASPAYELAERGGRVGRIEVSRARFGAILATGADPAARELLGRMALQHPAWRSGWTVAPSDDVAMVIDQEHPIAEAVMSLSGPVALASRLSLLTSGPGGSPRT